MNPPIKPSQDDCCNSGCNPCILDVYETQLKLYEEFKNNKIFNVCENGISQLKYTKFLIFDIVQLSDTLKTFKLKKLDNSDCQKVWWKPGYHFLIKYSDANKVCTRAYTPIKFNYCEDYDFLIVVKKYVGGLVSNYLFSLTVGNETLWRGPFGSYCIEPNKYNRIVMIAQGTGIAPFISIIINILNNEEDMTKLILYYCCRDIKEILFRDELIDFKTYWNFSYKIFVSCKTNGVEKYIKYNEPILNKKLVTMDLENLHTVSCDQYLLCGSDQFMKEYEVYLTDNNFSSNIILF